MEIKSKLFASYLNAAEFFQQAKLAFNNNAASVDKFALVSLDFDNFNFINDLFSYEVGDKVLQRLVEYFSVNLQNGEIFSRLHADHFVFLLVQSEATVIGQRLYALTDLKKVLADILPVHYNLVCSGGIVCLAEFDKNLEALLDKANFARKQAKGNHVNTFLHYDKAMNEKLAWRKAITLMMESALKEREFEMYLQPKVLIKTGQVVGAEALVRWNSKCFGMIYPDDFIPILEQNGFIKEVDFFMLEQACVFLQNSLLLGIAPLPISVNFSKIHIRTDNFVERVFKVVKKYSIPTEFVEIEFTENIFLGDFQSLIDITSALKCLGFKVSLDDFGSAYSSLNYLKDLPVDVIKIDKRFLNASVNTNRGRIIIAKIVELVKSLRMVTIMEGVETEEQVKFLQKLSCELGQGYFYARPLPQADYIEFIKQRSPIKDILPATPDVDKSYLQAIPQEFQMDNWELYILGKNIDMGLMKGYLDDGATVQYVNDRALEYLGYTRQEFHEIFCNSIKAFTYPDDVPIVQAMVQQLKSSGEPLAFKTRAIRKDGKVIILAGRSSCVIDSQGRPIGIYAFQDLTEQIERTELLQRSMEAKIADLEATIYELSTNQVSVKGS